MGVTMCILSRDSFAEGWYLASLVEFAIGVYFFIAVIGQVSNLGPGAVLL